MSLAILFHFLCAQHVSDINISIIRSFRLLCWITTFVVFFLVRCVLEFRCGWVGVVSVLQAEAVLQPATHSNTHRTKNNTTNVVIQQNSRNLLMMDILMSETCWAHKKWNKIASGIKLVFYSLSVQAWLTLCFRVEASTHLLLRTAALHQEFPNLKKILPNLSSVQITHIFKVNTQERADIYS